MATEARRGQRGAQESHLEQGGIKRQGALLIFGNPEIFTPTSHPIFQKLIDASAQRHFFIFSFSVYTSRQFFRVTYQYSPRVCPGLDDVWLILIEYVQY
jgi:hypothetical protein